MVLFCMKPVSTEGLQVLYFLFVGFYISLLLFCSDYNIRFSFFKKFKLILLSLLGWHW